MAILRWGRRWSPLEELDKMRRDMERLFRNALEPGGRQAGHFFGDRTFPLMNVYETPDEYVVTAEVPGVRLADIEISVTGDSLTVKGRRSPEGDCEKANCHRLERDFGSFGRTLNLPAGISTDQVDATYVNGVLQVKLAKAEESKPRVITVKS